MVVFIFARNMNSVRISGDIQNDIEDINKLNIKCEHGLNHREEITGIFDEKAESIERENLMRIHSMSPTENKPNLKEEFKTIKQNNKKTELSKIIIDDDVLKFDGTKLRIQDIIDSYSFGNGVSQTSLILKDGQKILVVTCVFPHISESVIMAKFAQLKTICEL